MSWYIDVLTNNYLNFNGRARRAEFWMFMLVHLIVIGILTKDWNILIYRNSSLNISLYLIDI